MICLSCTETTIKSDLELIERNRSYIDIAEIRVDFLAVSEYSFLKNLPSQAGLPCILTFRFPEDGGINPSVSRSERSELMLSALKGGWAYIDIEDDSESDAEKRLMRAAEDAGVKIIRSFHDFNGVPDRLAERMIENSKGNRYIPKAAVMPASTADLFKIIDAHQRLEQLRRSSAGYSCTNGPLLSDYILVGMGAYGFPSRILASAWGSMLTFSSAGSAKAAPGHISPEELIGIYNYKSLSKNTDVFGIIGNPVMHTKSPVLHNSAIRANSLDAVYIPFETDSPELLLKHAETINLKGISVTIPHKKTVMELASALDESVKLIGACNTLVKDGDWHGYNTDWLGFLAPLQADELSSRHALVIGAGGASRAVIYALKQIGMKITVINRTAEKAELLAADFKCSGGGFELLDNGDDYSYSLIVQTTSAGMEPDVKGNPMPDYSFSGNEIVYDIIYAPEKTAFLAAAESAGCRIINGFPMLKAQAVEQFRLFTGKTMT